MSNVIFCFLLSTFISFVGSLQLGPVNLSVIHTAINTDFKTSILVAIGGCVPEIIYCTCAFAGAELIMQHNNWLYYFQISSIFIFIAFGIVALLNAATPQFSPKTKSKSLLSGFTLGMLNPMLITFWLSIITYLQQFNIRLTENIYSKTAFIIGTATGAFILLLLFALIVSRNKFSFIQRQQNKINKIIGIIFILLAFIQFIKLI